MTCFWHRSAVYYATCRECNHRAPWPLIAAPNFLLWPQEPRFCQKFGICHGDYSGESYQMLALSFFLPHGFDIFLRYPSLRNRFLRSSCFGNDFISPQASIIPMSIYRSKSYDVTPRSRCRRHDPLERRPRFLSFFQHAGDNRGELHSMLALQSYSSPLMHTHLLPLLLACIASM